MPSGLPAPPPQQASLNELWKKGGKEKPSKGKRKETKQDDNMDIDEKKTNGKRKVT
jgi:hypothetical protein